LVDFISNFWFLVALRAVLEFQVSKFQVAIAETPQYSNLQIFKSSND